MPDVFSFNVPLNPSAIPQGASSNVAVRPTAPVEPRRIALAAVAASRVRSVPRARRGCKAGARTEIATKNAGFKGTKTYRKI